MTLHRYPLRSLVPDYGRGVAGAALSAGALALTGGAGYAAAIFGGLTALFLLFTMRTAMRQRVKVEMDDGTIGVIGGAGPLAWPSIDEVRLHYYATRRRRGNGWMTLTLKAGQRRLAVDSTIDGFEAIAARSVLAARANRLAPSAVTLANFGALGLPWAGGEDSAGELEQAG